MKIRRHNIIKDVNKIVVDSNIQDKIIVFVSCLVIVDNIKKNMKKKLFYH
jgi:hypothetical protein